MTTLPETNLVEREVRIAARPETIFAFLTDPAKLTRWQGTMATLDPRPGGLYHVVVSGQHVARGQFLAVEPYDRVVYTWGWEGNTEVPPGSSTVEITLTREGAETVVRLRHLGLPSGAVEPHGAGWAHYLPRLIAVAEGRDAGPDPWAV